MKGGLQYIGAVDVRLGYHFRLYVFFFFFPHSCSLFLLLSLLETVLKVLGVVGMDKFGNRREVIRGG